MDQSKLRMDQSRLRMDQFLLSFYAYVYVEIVIFAFVFSFYAYFYVEIGIFELFEFSTTSFLI